MSFLKKREPDNRGVHRLPKQPSPPTLKQLQAMLHETIGQGMTCQVTFGEPPEEYSLAVFKDRLKNEVHWALYLGEGEASMMVWDQASNDPGFIHQLITAQFPGWDLKPVALRPTATYQPTESSLAAKTYEQNYEQQSISSRIREKPTFEGDLKNMQMPNVMQSIAMSKGTGRLEVENGFELATIFFNEGRPVHAVSRGVEGESSFIELVGWEEGEFRFYPGIICEQRTIRRRMETMLMEGSTLDDQLRSLKEKGFTDNTYLVRKTAVVTEKEFEELLEKGTGADAELSKRIYQQLSTGSAGEIFNRMNLTRPQWVPVIFNLVSLDIIGLQDKAAVAPGAVADVQIDWSQALAAERVLMRSDTQILSYPAFLYFLKSELLRWERFGRPFSVVLLQISTAPNSSGGGSEPLSIPAIREVGERISKLKRKTDIFAHYETFGFALLLIETDGQAARAFANRLATSIMSQPVGAGLSAETVLVKAGAASVPDDCSTAESLLARARPI